MTSNYMHFRELLALYNEPLFVEIGEVVTEILGFEEFPVSHFDDVSAGDITLLHVFNRSPKIGTGLRKGNIFRICKTCSMGY